MFSSPLSNTTNLFHQSIYDLSPFLSESTTSSYGVDSFDLSLLGSDYSFENYQSAQIKCEDVVLSSSTGSDLALSIEIDSCYQYPTQILLKQENNNLDWQQQKNYLQSSSLLSPISPATTAHSSPSPCPSFEYSIIKQEKNIILPPSPPDSSGVPSPQSIHCENSYKVEQYDEASYVNQMVLSPNCTENSLDIKFLLESSHNREHKQQDHQVLREFLQDTSFQRKNNLKPLALESLFGLTQQGDIEPVISLALQHAKQEVLATCKSLKISPDPQLWTEEHVQLWINSTITQFKLDPITKSELAFPENGQMFAMLSDEEFIQRAPQIGSILHAQLEIWKAAFVDSSQIDINLLTSSTVGISSSQANTVALPCLSQTSLWNQMLNDDSDISDEESSDKPMEIDLSVPTPLDSAKEQQSSRAATTSKPKGPKKHHSHLQKKGTQSSHIHLWQFLKELLASPQANGTAIRWLDRAKGIFKIEDSVRVAKLWGRRKNRPAMNYDKLSRSIRQYYKKGIMKKTERSQRLVYQFCHPYSL